MRGKVVTRMGPFRFAATLALLLALPLAGCIGGDDGTGPTSPTDDNLPAFSKAEAAIAFHDAASSLTSDTGPARMSITFRADALNSTGNEFAEMDGLFDRAKGLVVFSVEGEVAESGSESNPFAKPGEALVLAQVWKTTLFGSTTQLLGLYNESAEPPTNMSDVSGPSTPGGGSGQAFDEGDFLKFLGSPAADGIRSVEPTVHEGKPGMKITFSDTQGSVTVRGEAIVTITPAATRLALVTGTIRDPEAEDRYARDATFRVDFDYDAAATHALEATVERLEVLTYAGNGGGFGGAFGGGAPADTWTIQPSHSSVSVPLAEIEARISESSGFGGDPTAEPALVLALEAGSAENADVKATFTDADGNGKVSAGDSVKLETKNPDKSFTVQLFDEKTGVVLMPGFGLLAGLAALGALAVAGRRARK